MIEMDESLRTAIAAAWDNGHPFVLAAVDADGQPSASYYGTLQAIDGQRMGLWSRRPANLLARIGANPKVALAHWDPDRKVLVRCEGRAEVTLDEATRTTIFEGSPEAERASDPERKGTAVVIELTRVYGFLHGERFDMRAESSEAPAG